jgi:hypothetical protein
VIFLDLVIMTSRSEFDVSMEEASAAIDSVTSYQTSKKERGFDKTSMRKSLPFFATRSKLYPGDKVRRLVDVANRPDLQNLTSTAAKTLSDMKPYISNFASNSQLLMDALKQLGQLHPCINGAPALSTFNYSHSPMREAVVLVFNATLTLELNRQENDKKVLVLMTTMSDMMRVLEMYDSRLVL